MDSVRVDLGPRSYTIAFGGVAAAFGSFVREALPNTKLTLIAADENVQPFADRVQNVLVAAGLSTSRLTIPSGEASKSPAQLEKVYDALARMPADRNTAVIAVGGGVVGDLSGFAAATYNRGIPLVMVPTTLLAMVDSSVGGKTGINHARGKNLIGAFHQPAGVWIDLMALQALPEREYRSGLAEVIKYGVILDAAFFEQLEANTAKILDRDPVTLLNVIARCCQLKAEIVRQDEREETGVRAVLNYGHTFAHAFETLGDYRTHLHGEAVAMGMGYAAKLAEKLGRVDLVERQAKLITTLVGDFAVPKDWTADAMIDLMKRDKKAAAGKMVFVLPTRLGNVERVEGVEEARVREVLG